jgi:magnesium and cobalt transporter
MGLESSRFSLKETLKKMFLPQKKTKAKLIEHVALYQKKDVIDNNAFNMIKGVLNVSEMQVRDCMVPRAQMVVIDKDLPPEQFISTIISSKHSRFPVISKTKDQVIGVLLAKDLLSYTFKKRDKVFDIMKLCRKANFVPESKHLDSLLHEFQSKHAHMAIVIDEYGGVSGLVTIEDLIEPIVGDIEDEYYEQESEGHVKSVSDKKFIIKALMTIENFNQHFSVNLDNKLFDTIGGFLSQRFGCIPKIGQSIKIDAIKFTILHSDKRRVYLIEVVLL